MTEDIIRRIQGLLNKAEGTKNEHEAATFLEGAQRLMLKYQIDEAALAAANKAAGKVEEIVTKLISIKKKPMTPVHQTFLNRLAHLYSCRMWYVRGTEANYVVGYEGDVRFVEMLFVSVQIQMLTSLAAAGGGKGQPRPIVWRKNYADGYYSRVISRMQDIKHKVEDETGPGTSIVLRDRGLAVQDWLDENLNLKTARKTQARIDWAARAAGARDGDHADISAGINKMEKPERKELT